MARKYALIIPDGTADEPQESLNGRTPLEAAATPNMDRIAREGVVGRANNVPDSLPAGSDVATLSLFGYDPLECYTGRAPLEAAAQGIQLGPDDWAIRCNLVTIENGIMADFTAGHVSTEQARELIGALSDRLGGGPLEFHAGVSYRNLLVYRGGTEPAPFDSTTRTTPPHDLTDKEIAGDWPSGAGAELLQRLVRDSQAVLAEHPVNRARRETGEKPATHIWLWGQGMAPALESFSSRYGKQGAIVTAVDLLRGLGALLGWKRIEVPGATGYLDTDYAAKGSYAVNALPAVDLICVHVEATDEASHEGDAAAKVEALEQIDRHVVGPLREALEQYGEYRILISPDHPTPLRLKTHEHGFVPFALAGAGIQPDAQEAYSEPSARRSDLEFDPGWKLMAYFLQ